MEENEKRLEKRNWKEKRIEKRMKKHTFICLHFEDLSNTASSLSCILPISFYKINIIDKNKKKYIKRDDAEKVRGRGI